jgi:hypothetical protein
MGLGMRWGMGVRIGAGADGSVADGIADGADKVADEVAGMVGECPAVKMKPACDSGYANRRINQSIFVLALFVNGSSNIIPGGIPQR